MPHVRKSVKASLLVCFALVLAVAAVLAGTSAYSLAYAEEAQDPQALGDPALIEEAPIEESTLEEEESPSVYGASLSDCRVWDARAEYNTRDLSHLAKPQVFYGQMSLKEYDPATGKGDYEIRKVKDVPCIDAKRYTQTFQIVGKNGYTGSKYFDFVIEPASVSKCKVTPIPDVVYNGKEHRPTVEVRFEPFEGTSILLKQGTDYYLTYKNNVNAGTATVTINGYNTSWDKTFKGEKDVTFKIEKADISNATIGSIMWYNYTGNPCEPEPSVKLDGTYLSLGTDFLYKYRNNIQPGTATVLIEGRGNCFGTATKEFRIFEPAPIPDPDPRIEWKRLAGKNAMLTMREIVRKLFSDVSGGTVVIATSASFKDALSAAALAGKYGAPILMTPKDALSAVTKSEINRLKPARAIIVGGTAAVSEGVESEIKGLVANVERIAGSNAADTSRKIAAEVGASPTVIIATSADFADALSIAPWSYGRRAPIILTSASGQLAQMSLSCIKASGAKTAIIVGGELAVNKNSEDMLVSAGLTVKRLAGSTALGTSEAIAKWELQNGFSLAHVACATRTSYKDALAGSALMGNLDGPILLVNGSNWSCVRNVLKGNVPQTMYGYFLGGEAVISADVAKNIEQIR